MEGEVKGKTYKMKGHTLPGINQRLDATATNVAEQGLAGSSAFQKGIGKYKGEGSYGQKPPAPKQMIDPMQSGVTAGAPINPAMQAPPIMKKSMAKGFFGDVLKGKGAAGILNPAGAIGGKLGLW